MIKLIDDYVVQVDKYNFALARDKGINKKGVENLMYLSYHRSLADAVNACRQEYIRRGLQERDMSLSEAMTTIKELDRKFYEGLDECLK